jgi:hypothetical protein
MNWDNIYPQPELEEEAPIYEIESEIADQKNDEKKLEELETLNKNENGSTIQRPKI